ncbi:MAG: hypothetical protein KDB21_06420 [Acidimicrobiales bacterium]|nr:hypothetical protein [Acidimicrobiales bacterium]
MTAQVSDVVLAAFAPGPVRLDGVSRLHAPAAGWTLDWRVRADDRWRDPAEEVAVRRHGLVGGVGVETALRVPSGDALVRCWVAPHGAGSLAVFEVENDSPVPFVIAVRLHAPGHALEADGTAVRLDGRTGLWSARPPRETTPTADGGIELAWPVPHRTTLRLLLPTHPLTSDAAPATVPGLDDAATGWRTITDRGLRFELPEAGLSDLVAAAVRRTLVAAVEVEAQSSSGGVEAPVEELARLAIGLAGAGHHDAAVRLVAVALDRLGPDGAVVGEGLSSVGALAAAIGRIAATGADPDLAAALTEPSIALAEHLAAAGAKGRGRRRRDNDPNPWLIPGLDGAALTLERAGDPGAARARAVVPSGDATELDAAALVRSWWRDELLVEPSSSISSSSAVSGVAAADVLDAIAKICVRERADGLELVPGMADHWVGAPLEVYDQPTRHGKLSWAVRWHGERPALLWELDTGGRPDPPGGVALRIPALDPTWSDRRPRGEALLGAVADARLEPAPLRRGDETPTAPLEGESFS